MTATRPHAYDPDPLGTTKTPPCRCGMTKAYRGHQPLWWRALHPGAKWRLSPKPGAKWR